MKRHILAALSQWKGRANRKPLVMQGARQVGKTWAMKAFGASDFAQTAYVNFDNNPRMQALFAGDFDIQRLLLGLRIETGVDIQPENTLLIFDEVQEVPQALSSLKYFYENAPEFSIVAAGSLLGITLHHGTSFPVGKVDFLPLYPMDFREFLLAMAQQPLLDLLEAQDWQMITAMKSKYMELLRQYYFTGGMPEAVKTFVQSQDLQAVREVQNGLLLAYEQDFSKHIADPRLVMRVRALWNALPSQLARENKKFMIGQVQQGGRLKDFELALQWLRDSGLIYPVYRVKKPHLPLTGYQDNVFKLFCLDVGLLAAKSFLEPRVLLEGNRLFTEFKGALTEQYVLQQLQVCQRYPLFYWATDKGTAEVDFIVQRQQAIVPLEVKAEENLRAKSLKSYCEQFQPPLALRVSMSDYRQESWLTNVPLYAISEFARL
ncbi:MAG: ATP-binding protein [Cardiobacterium sp.]